MDTVEVLSSTARLFLVTRPDTWSKPTRYAITCTIRPVLDSLKYVLAIMLLLGSANNGKLHNSTARLHLY